MTHLSEKRCRIIDEDEEALSGDDLTHYMAQLDNSWEIIKDSYLSRVFHKAKHEEALELVQDISEIAMSEDHYPEIMLSFGVVKVLIKTSEVDGLHENDFILASKIDRVSDRD